MQVTNIDYYTDGGTIFIKTEEGREFCFDFRIGSRTRGRLFNGYPKNSSYVQEAAVVEDLIKALKEFSKNDLKMWQANLVGSAIAFARKSLRFLKSRDARRQETAAVS